MGESNNARRMLLGCAFAWVVSCAPRSMRPAIREPAASAAGQLDDASFRSRAEHALDLYFRGADHRVEAAREVLAIASEMKRSRNLVALPVRAGAGRPESLLSPDRKFVLQRLGSDWFVQELQGGLVGWTPRAGGWWIGAGAALISSEHASGYVLFDATTRMTHHLPDRNGSLRVAGSRIVRLRLGDEGQIVGIDVADRSSMTSIVTIAVSKCGGSDSKGCRIGRLKLSADGGVVSWFDGIEARLWSTSTGKRLFAGRRVERVAFHPGAPVAVLASRGRLEKVDLSSESVIASLRRPSVDCTAAGEPWPDDERLRFSANGSKVIDFDANVTVVDSDRWLVAGTVLPPGRMPDSEKECVYPEFLSTFSRSLDENERYLRIGWKGSQSTLFDARMAKTLSSAQEHALTEAEIGELLPDGRHRYLRMTTNIAVPVIVDLSTLRDLDSVETDEIQRDEERRQLELGDSFVHEVCSVGSFVFPREICPRP